MASALELFVNNVRTLSKQGNFRELSEIISKSTDVLIKNGQHLDNVLETLNLQEHSLGILAVLCVKFSLPNPNGANNADAYKPLFSQVQEFIIGCNGEQVRFASDIYAELCHLFTQTLVELQIPLRGIELLCRAIRKIQLFDSQLTSIHADLCQLCLLSKCFKPALEFLDIDVTGINQEEGQFDSKYFLLYYYYGGMIYTALKNYDRALYFFEVCVTTPAMAVSYIMLEAYKKYILVSLILHGKVLNLPRYTSQVVNRYMKPLGQQYQELATAYQMNSCEEVQNIITKYQQLFTRDHNMGLVKQVLSYLYKKNIQRLTKTFLTLSLSDVASRVQLSGPADAEKYILNMIEDGEIFATINQKDGMVVFHDDPEKYNSPQMLAKLEKEMAACMELDKRVLEMEEEVVLTPQYVRKACGQNDQDDQTAGPAPTNVTNVQGQSKHSNYSM
ncbi:COP9 signalosome complex subunit 3 [Apis laboriosa]|uniref:COP9 signalosome complex subunit 3 n=2 Tax=Apis TaxID=7459 RepID=A0A7M7MNQ3_APIME|nr:COP9 signalosome complex subunit 3 [Apis dorsata]XP_016911397.2 COP9 signalosome complex subunit 3 [Apis cerana]XP_026298722.1 COP9 signalosome complex subunit 3 [Apis mellifera]XP_031367826.1 COP9 signalosome complex subunit 3 [Apis dorsata]XP_043789862.1 COP9 signalosome complex subunit 3 [Apis laboriosa]KAG6801106.1 COP9 signalosome complex subunit 3-like [Apis mellifera caucasica]KAG9430940.1 COP9 signalosome complex subunit 3-like [Apis mellifera carnica]PBC34019.1 COP9 signalosome c|eukprot:XP_026298722.1 COP9 signalosome complex subunit 3 [Apis mellifera]